MKLLIFSSLVFLNTSVLAESYEVPTTYKMEAVVPANLRSAKEYRLGSLVGHNGYLYLFDVYSLYGDYKVKGLASLENLAFELQVLTQLQELESSKVFLDAAEKGGVSIVFAPLKTVGSLVDAVANPGETWDMIKKVPAGVEGLFDWAVNRVSNGASDVADAFSSKDEKQKKEADSLASKGADSAVKLGLDYLGYNELQRAWCEKTSIDPYTTNGLLRDRIARLAEVETAVKFGFKFAPGIDLGAVQKVNSYMGKTKKVSLYADPYYASDQNKLILKEMGISEPEIKKFTSNKNFSGTMVTLLVAQLDELEGVENRNAILGAAAEISSKEGALYLVQSMKYLVKLKEDGEKFVKFLPGAHVPAVFTSNGELLIPLALDRVIWTKEMADTVSDTILKAKSDPSFKVMKIRTSAVLSDRMKEELTNQGILFQERVPMAL